MALGKNEVWVIKVMSKEETYWHDKWLTAETEKKDAMVFFLGIGFIVGAGVLAVIAVLVRGCA